MNILDEIMLLSTINDQGNDIFTNVSHFLLKLVSN